MQYRELFGYIPDFGDYDCTHEEFLKAMNRAVSEKKELSEFIPHKKEGKSDSIRLSLFKELMGAARPARIRDYIISGLTLAFTVFYMFRSPGSIPATLLCGVIVVAFCAADWWLRYADCHMTAYNSDISLGTVSGFSRTVTMKNLVRVKPRDISEQTDATGNLIEISCTFPRKMRHRLYPETAVLIVKTEGLLHKYNFPLAVPDMTGTEVFKSI